MKIVIDADACPRGVLAICRELADFFEIPICTIASFNHVVKSPNHIVVGDNSQEVDFKVLNMADKGDIVVTQDIGLAAMVLAKGCQAISPVGRVFTAYDMTFLLEEREAKARLRRSGGRTKGPSKRDKLDDDRFKDNLLSLIKRILSD